MRHDIKLVESSSLVLRVTHALTGAPIADADASLIWRGQRIEVARSDEQGRMRVSVQGDAPRSPAAAERPVRWRDLSIHAPGMLATVAPWLRAGELAGELPVRLVPAAHLCGTVLSAAGEPLAGADVRWIAPLQVLDRSAGPVENGPGSFRALTGSDGRFELREVLWAVPDAAVGVWIGGERRRVLFGVAPEAAGATRELELRLLGAPALAGRVVWPRRERLSWRAPSEEAPPAATVRAVPASGAEALEAPCDGAGAFLLAGLAPGEYDVSAADALGQRAQPVRVQVPGPEAESLELVLYPPPRTLSGRILTHDGLPWSGPVEVSATGAGWRQKGTMTDADGFFSAELVVLPEDEVEVSIDLGHTLLSHALPAAGGMVWTLPELLLVRVRVVPGAGGGEAPPPGPGRFRWRRPDGGDESTVMLASARVGPLLSVPKLLASSEHGARIDLAGLGYVRSAPAVLPGDETELELPRGTVELWLEFPGDPRRVVERRVELPVDAPGGVLVIEL